MNNLDVLDIKVGMVFDTAFETNCVVRTYSDETGSFMATDSMGYVSNFSVEMVQLPPKGLYNLRTAYRDADDMWTFPAWMCENTIWETTGHASDGERPCGREATHIITFWEWSGNPDNGELSDYDPSWGTWHEHTQRVCLACFEACETYAEVHDKEVQISHIVNIHLQLRSAPRRP